MQDEDEDKDEAEFDPSQGTPLCLCTHCGL